MHDLTAVARMRYAKRAPRGAAARPVPSERTCVLPLYDFHCDACDRASILMKKYEDPAFCPRCGSHEMTRRLAPFAVGATVRSAPKGTSLPEAAPSPRSASAHTHGHGATHTDHSHTAAACGAAKGSASQEAGPVCRSAYVDAVLKKYLP
jgi:putative FmdB family regulatory protein